MKNSNPQTGDNMNQEMKNSEFHHLFVEELQDIYWAEQQLLKALPKMQKAASSEDLMAALDTHIKETETHVQRLEKVFELLEEKPKARKCEAMAGLIVEGNEVLSDTNPHSFVRDAGIIVSAQKMEHYEIATYGSLVTWANRMGHMKVADLLAETLDNEKETDATLTDIAVNYINEEALSE